MDKGSAKESRGRLLRETGKGFGVVAVLALLMLWLSGAFLDKVEPGPPQSRAQPAPLKIHRVEHRTFPLIIDQVGTVRTETEAQVSSRIMAQVKEILVREGATVAAAQDGQSASTVIARLDDRDIQARLQQAQSQVSALQSAREAAQAKLSAARAQVQAATANRQTAFADYRRYQELYSKQAATGQQLEHARAQSDVAGAQAQAAAKEVQAAQREVERILAQKQQAEAATEEARVMLSHTVIQAPFSGRVVRKMVDVGDMAIPGQPLFSIETPGQPELHAFVSESMLPQVHVGQELEVRIDALNRTFPGSVREIAPRSDPATRTVRVKAALPPDPQLVNGLFGRLLIPHGEYRALVVPTVAVREVGQLYLLDVVDADGFPQRRFVTLGPRHDDVVEILSGVKEGEEVVIP